MVTHALSLPIAVPQVRSDRERVLPVLRWAIFAAAALALCALALSRAGAVRADAPTNCIPINYTTCVTYGGFYGSAPAYGGSYVAPNTSYVAPGTAYVSPNTTSSGYPPNTVISTYYDPRYGVVSVVTDSSGNLIDINAATGQRIYPYLPDYGYGYGYGYLNGNYAYINGNGCTYGNYSCLGAYNGCTAGNFSCLGYYPYYGYTGAFTGNYTVVAPSGGVIKVGPPYRVAEVKQTAPAAEVTTVTASPVAQPVQVAAPAPAAPQMATALNANSAPVPAPAVATGGAGVHILSAQPATAPAATSGADDHHG